METGTEPDVDVLKDEQPLRRDVGVDLAFESSGDVDVALMVAPLRSAGISESLHVAGPDGPLEPSEVLLRGQGRAHRFLAGPGRYDVEYRATVVGQVRPTAVTPAEELLYLRPSRFVESDRLQALARAEFGRISDPALLAESVAAWVATRLSYVRGSSRPTDGAIDTYLDRQGVCRDYAHLVVGMLRARDTPARVAAVYAPGLDPMDFHAVAEVAVDGRWCVLDGTVLAPRSSMLRITSGRDAADISFLSTYRGDVELVNCKVSAGLEGILPEDDITALVSLT